MLAQLLGLLLPIGCLGVRAYIVLTVTLSALALAAALTLGPTTSTQWANALIALAPGKPFFVGCRFAQVQALTCGLWGGVQALALWAGFFWIGFCLSAARLRDAGVRVWRLVGLYALLFVAQALAAAGLSYADAAGRLAPNKLSMAGDAALALTLLAHAFLRVWPALAKQRG